MRAVLFILTGLLCCASVAAAAVLPADGSTVSIEVQTRAFAAPVTPQLMAEPDVPEETCACKRNGVCGQQQPTLSGGANILFSGLTSSSAMRPPGALGRFDPYICDLELPPPRLASTSA